jgi:transcriptional regulator with XRE-family HTH domain
MKRRFILIIARLKKNFTTRYMADQLGITRTQYSRIENGHTQILKQEHVDKVASLLDISSDHIDLDEEKFVIGDTLRMSISKKRTKKYHSSNIKLLKKIKRLEKTIHIQKEMIHQFVQKLAPQKFKKHQED